ncbi:hypothetical protein BH11PSE5_BH11PSE5_30770 [soil metagenome]
MADKTKIEWTDPLKDLPRLDDTAMGPCVICQRQLLETELPIFFRVEARQCGLDRLEINRHVGLAMQMGGGRDGLALASIMGPGVKPVIVMETITPFNVCHPCAMDRGLVDVLGYQWERDRVAKGLPVPARDDDEGEEG